MKKSLPIICAALLLLSVPVDAGNRHRQRLTNQCSLTLILRELPEEPLTDTEISDLQLMREEEKFARDVYLSLYDKWEVQPFSKIARQEKVHMKTVRLLLRKYDLEDPAKGAAIGVFQNSALRQLYGDLVEFGSFSLRNAFEVGVLVEEMDIADLQTVLTRTDNEDIGTLYQNLMKGSRNHLRTFATRLAVEDSAEYEPEFLSQAEYDEIVDSPREKGGVLDADGNYICGGTRNRRGGN